MGMTVIACLVEIRSVSGMMSKQLTAVRKELCWARAGIIWEDLSPRLERSGETSREKCSYWEDSAAKFSLRRQVGAQ